MAPTPAQIVQASRTAMQRVPPSQVAGVVKAGWAAFVDAKPFDPAYAGIQTKADFHRLLTFGPRLVVSEHAFPE